MDDKPLRQDVIEALEFEPSLDAESIGFAEEHETITAGDQVPSSPRMTAPERAARRVRGAEGIAQNVDERIACHERGADDEIAQRAVSILAWNTRVPHDAVTISVSDGWATLSGKVSWNYQRTAAEAAVRELPGVVGVSNQIELAARAHPDDIRQRITGALAKHARLEADRIGIVVDGATVTISGTVDNWDERFAVQRAVWSVSGVRDVVDHLQVA